MNTDDERLLEDLLDGDHRALARVITKVENRAPGYRDLVSAIHAHTGDADVVGITGSPGAGKSTLVDKLASTYRDQGYTVGVIAIDPSSPFSGGSVLGDRIRMASNVGDMDVFFRSMSARGSLGGLSTATTDAVRALDAFGKDKIIIETVGAGQNEVDIVKTADTVAVLVPPGAGDDIQMLKAGILEIADVFVVNKADKDGADMTVKELREMINLTREAPDAGHHGPEAMMDVETALPDADEDDDAWVPPIVETIATDGVGVTDLIETFDDHADWLEATGEREANARKRYADEIRTLLREDTASLLADELEARGGLEAYAESVLEKESDPYTIADEVLGPFEECLEQLRTADDAAAPQNPSSS